MAVRIVGVVLKCEVWHGGRPQWITRSVFSVAEVGWLDPAVIWIAVLKYLTNSAKLAALLDLPEK